MTDKELIARLRELDTWVETADIPDLAADRIEALTKERDQWISHAKTAIWSDSEELKETERKLAQAVKGLEDLVRDCEADYPPSHGAIKYFCRTTLAEIKGESHE